jgi:hypothetical protein
MMMPPFNAQGDVPPGVHQATLMAVGERFGQDAPTLTPNPLEVHEVFWLTAAEAVQHPDVRPHTDAFLTALKVGGL